MNTAVIAVHFGEPPRADPEMVRTYLTNIFYQNAALEQTDSDAEAKQRAEMLAERRLPGLLEEYEAIGGSPMNSQAREQIEALNEELFTRGFDIRVELAFQFMQPSIESVLESFREAGIDHVIALPIYPLCGPSTTVAALERIDDAIEHEDDWNPEVSAISGWHRYPGYLRLRTDNIRRFLSDRGLELHDPQVRLLFSAHGTPIHYLESGSRYRIYTEEWCDSIAGLLGGIDFELGYQNHENRDIPWTQPDIESVVSASNAEAIVVEPVSFMHEQSETLSELDDELAEHAGACGLEFHRIPIPHDDPAFPKVLADLVEPFLAGIEPAMYQLRPCECASDSSSMCLNAPRG